MSQPSLWLWLAPAQMSAAADPSNEPAQHTSEKALLVLDEGSADDDQTAEAPVQSGEDAPSIEIDKNLDNQLTQNTLAQVKPIGYGSPPVAHQWRASQSGNPRGRPKKNACRNAVEITESRLLSIVRREANREINASERGKPVKIRTLEGIVRGIATKALQGNPRQLKIFLELAKAAELEPCANILDLVGPKITKKDVQIILKHPEIKKEIEEISKAQFDFMIEILTPEQRDELRNHLKQAYNDAAYGDERDV